MKNSNSVAAMALKPMSSAFWMTRRSVARGQTASAFSENSARNSNMSPSNGMARQVSGNTRTGASG
jgi:hypothetical protein